MMLSNISKRFQKYSKLDEVVFDGDVAGVKEAAKLTDIDFRNPCISIDFGTTLDSRVTGPDQPYANTIGSFCGSMILLF